ncbi:MAG: cobalamin biosynthesis protein CobD [Bacteroidales bacterium]|nr:cobalamin biosynthesis protein CobD [Bacteroidales bacterium]
MIRLYSLLAGWLLDFILGDPSRLPHPVVGFGKLIAAGEKRWNRGRARGLKGALMTLLLVTSVFGVTWILCDASGSLSPWLRMAVEAILIFYCLAGTTLVREVRAVFKAVDRSLEEGRAQVARIVGRDTANLSAQEVRTAALETLAENLNDGVVAPLFWYALGGVPGMVAYKMVNTLDSMIGYRNERYRRFGCFAARLDDVAGWIPARLTAFLMLLVSGRLHKTGLVYRRGRGHLSPNSGHPEAALATILDCRFGGPHDYFGEEVYKPYIGDNDRPLTRKDLRRSILIFRGTELVALLLVAAVVLAIHCFTS